MKKPVSACLSLLLAVLVPGPGAYAAVSKTARTPASAPSAPSRLLAPRAALSADDFSLPTELPTLLPPSISAIPVAEEPPARSFEKAQKRLAATVKSAQPWVTAAGRAEASPAESYGAGRSLQAALDGTSVRAGASEDPVVLERTREASALRPAARAGRLGAGGTALLGVGAMGFSAVESAGVAAAAVLAAAMAAFVAWDLISGGALRDRFLRVPSPAARLQDEIASLWPLREGEPSRMQDFLSQLRAGGAEERRALLAEAKRESLRYHKLLAAYLLENEERLSGEILADLKKPGFDDPRGLLRSLLDHRKGSAALQDPEVSRRLDALASSFDVGVRPSRRRSRIWGPVAGGFLAAAAATAVFLGAGAFLDIPRIKRQGEEAARTIAAILYGEDRFIFIDVYVDVRLTQALRELQAVSAGPEEEHRRAIEKLFAVIHDSADPKADSVLEVLLRLSAHLPISEKAERSLADTLIDRGGPELWELYGKYIDAGLEDPAKVARLARVIDSWGERADGKGVGKLAAFFHSPNAELRARAVAAVEKGIARLEKDDVQLPGLTAVSQLPEFAEDPQAQFLVLKTLLRRLSAQDAEQVWLQNAENIVARSMKVLTDAGRLEEGYAELSKAVREKPPTDALLVAVRGQMRRDSYFIVHEGYGLFAGAGFFRASLHLSSHAAPHFYWPVNRFELERIAQMEGAFNQLDWEVKEGHRRYNKHQTPFVEAARLRLRLIKELGALPGVDESGAVAAKTADLVNYHLYRAAGESPELLKDLKAAGMARRITKPVEAGQILAQRYEAKDLLLLRHILLRRVDAGGTWAVKKQLASSLRSVEEQSVLAYNQPLATGEDPDSLLRRDREALKAGAEPYETLWLGAYGSQPPDLFLARLATAIERTQGLSEKPLPYPLKVFLLRFMVRRVAEPRGRSLDKDGVLEVLESLSDVKLESRDPGDWKLLGEALDVLRAGNPAVYERVAARSRKWIEREAARLYDEGRKTFRYTGGYSPGYEASIEARSSDEGPRFEKVHHLRRLRDELLAAVAKQKDPDLRRLNGLDSLQAQVESMAPFLIELAGKAGMPDGGSSEELTAYEINTLLYRTFDATFLALSGDATRMLGELEAAGILPGTGIRSAIAAGRMPRYADYPESYTQPQVRRLIDALEGLVRTGNVRVSGGPPIQLDGFAKSRVALLAEDLQEQYETRYAVAPEDARSFRALSRRLGGSGPAAEAARKALAGKFEGEHFRVVSAKLKRMNDRDSSMIEDPALRNALMRLLVELWSGPAGDAAHAAARKETYSLVELKQNWYFLIKDARHDEGALLAIERGLTEGAKRRGGKPADIGAFLAALALQENVSLFLLEAESRFPELRYNAVALGLRPHTSSEWQTITEAYLELLRGAVEKESNATGASASEPQLEAARKAKRLIPAWKRIGALIDIPPGGSIAEKRAEKAGRILQEGFDLFPSGFLPQLWDEDLAPITQRNGKFYPSYSAGETRRIQAWLEKILKEDRGWEWKGTATAPRPLNQWEREYLEKSIAAFAELLREFPED